MKLVFKIFLLLTAHFSTCQCKTATIIGSHLANTDSPYKLFVESKGITSVKLSLGGGNEKSLDGSSINSILEEFEPPAKESDSYSLKVSTADAGNCKEKSVKLIQTNNRPIVFIYLSKPIYKTGDNLSFRIFVLDQNLIPITSYNQMTVKIFDSSKNLIKKFEDAKVSNYEEFKESIQIADDPNLGKWRIDVEIDDRITSKTFEVRKHVQGDIEVLVDFEPIVAFEDRRIYFKIYTKNEDENFVLGNTKINFDSRFEGSNRKEHDNVLVKTVNLDSSKTSLDVNFQDDLQIRFPSKDMILTFNFEVTETSTQKSKIISAEVLMKHKGKHTIEVARKRYFKPGFKFPAKVRVKTFDGKLDNSFNQLSISIEYRKGNNKLDEKSYQVNLKNGEYGVALQPSADATKIILNLQFAGIEHKEEIEKLPTFGSNEYMQVSVIGKSTVNTNQKISAQTSGEMENLHVLVFGSSGIVHSNEFTDAVGKDVYNFTIPVTEEMKPEARGLVFYIKPESGLMIYDEFTVAPGLSIENSLEITADQSVKSNQDLQINIKQEAGSNVFLSVTDHNSAMIDRNNEISRSDIYNELTYYINMKFPNNTRYHFEKLNAFILEPLIDGTNCKSRKGSTSNDDSVVDTPPKTYNYFPDVILDKKVGTSVSLNKITSNINSLRVFGVSVHPTKGFTVAKEQPIIAVKSDFALHIEAPSLIRVSEILKIKIVASNFLQSKMDGDLTVEIKNGTFMKGTNKEESQVKTESISIESKGNPSTIEYFVSSDELNPIEIKVVLKIGSDEYIKEKSIKVVPFTQKATLQSFLLQKSTGKKLTCNDDSKLVVYGNLLGPALNGFETMFTTPLQLEEEKMLKFAAAVINYKFMKLHSLQNGKIAKKAEVDMIKGYQEALPILHKYSKDTSSQSMKLTAIILEILIDAKDLIDVDEELILGALNHIKNQYMKGNEFKIDASEDPRRDFNENKSHKEIQTAMIIQTFIKAEDITQDYGDVIENSLRFLKKGCQDCSVYVNALIAYTLALRSDTTSAAVYLAKIENKLEKDPNKPRFHPMLAEALSYAIRTKILINKVSKSDVEKLISYRNANGGFYSPYTTVVALKALYAYSDNQRTSNTKISFKLNGNDRTIDVKLTESSEIKCSKDTNDMLNVKDEGLGYGVVYHKTQNPPIKKSFLKCDNIISEISSNEKILPIKFSFAPKTKELDLIVVELDMPRGYKFDSVMSSDFKYKMEFRDDNNGIVFYVDKVNSSKEYSMKVKSSKLYDIKNAKSSKLRIYDYYRPHMSAIGYLTNPDS